MPTPNEIREMLPARMTALGISLTDLSRLSGWSHSNLSGFLSGKRRGMHVDDVTRLYLTVTNLERLAEIVKPIVINFKDTGMTQLLLQKIAEGRFPTGDNDTGFARAQIILAAFKAEEVLQDGK